MRARSHRNVNLRGNFGSLVWLFQGFFVQKYLPVLKNICRY